MAIDIEDLVDHRGFGGFQLRIVVLCLLVQFVDGFDNQAIAFVAPAITRQWHISRDVLGPVFGAGAFGTLVGSLAMGPLGDWLGRKTLILASLVAIALLMALTTQASSVHELLILRFLAGCPLGALIPSTVVMANEWSPRRHRAAMVTMMACGFALGAAIGGLISSFLLPVFGWPSVFWVGGTASALLAVCVLVMLPESMRFLALHQTARARARLLAVLRDFAPDHHVPADAVFIAQPRPSGKSVAALFTDGRTQTTLLLWAAFFMNMLVMNFLNNWLPTLISGTGVPIGQAVRITTLFQIGGVIGVLLIGAVADRLGVWRRVGAVYLLSGLFVGGIGLLMGSVAPLSVAVGLAGFCVIGTQMSISALSATLYPTAIRSTGASWGLGIGRIGSSLGPLLGGWMIGWRWELPDMFLVLGSVSLCGFVALLLLARRAQHVARLSVAARV